MKNLFTIGEMADLFGINIRTLRYYDEIGILHPETADPDTGYRYYSTRQFERLNTIKLISADVSLWSLISWRRHGGNLRPIENNPNCRFSAAKGAKETESK